MCALLEAEERCYAGQDGVSMIVTNLDDCITSEDLYKLFLPYGRIGRPRVVKGQNGAKNHGFLRFFSRAEASVAALKIHGCRLGNGIVDVGITPVNLDLTNLSGGGNGLSRPGGLIIPPTLRFSRAVSTNPPIATRAAPTPSAVAAAAERSMMRQQQHQPIPNGCNSSGPSPAVASSSRELFKTIANLTLRETPRNG